MIVANRQEAQAIVDLYTVTMGQFQAVHAVAALMLLGEESYLRLCKDNFRRHGPRKWTFYPWNVVDYLSGAVPVREKQATPRKATP